MNYFAAFDSETGGLNPEVADMLTFYMGLFDENFKLVEEVDLKLKPEGRLPVADAGALKVNGIDLKAHLANPETVTYAVGRERVLAMLKRHYKKVGRSSNIRPLGYNVPFDEKFTFQHLISQADWLNVMHYKRVDVMERVDFLKECGWFPKELGSLGTVVDYLQIPKRSAHNAKEDTLMTVDVYKKLLEIMRNKKEGGSGQQQDLIALLEAE